MDLLLQDITEGWEFAFAEPGTLKSPADTDTLQFRSATVPGTNLTDLQAAGLVQEDTSANYEASFAPFARMDFVYRASFDAGDLAHKEQVELCFEGLDTVCEIFLNGTEIGRTQNAFRGHEFNVRDLLHQGDNELLLIFRSPLLEAARRQQEFGLKFPTHLDLNYVYLRKPGYSFFWDWGPKIAVIGIYRPAYLRAYNHGRIEDYYIRYDIEGSTVRGAVQVWIQSRAAARIDLHLAGRTLSANVEAGRAEVAFDIPDARLWYPNGEGEAYLYDLELVLSADEVLDTRKQRIGFRTVEVVQEERADGAGTRFLFKVNGKEIFCRGYNWIPPDNSIPRGYYHAYHRLLDLAREGNVNMLRIWGGGYYEDDEFYRLCDERGILVWQDGMFVCSLYPDTDPEFMREVEAELSYNIRRLRSFTSLALWCGENECHEAYYEWWRDRRDEFPRFFGQTIYRELYPRLAAQLDPDRFYWPGSPCSLREDVRPNYPLSGDCHWWDVHKQSNDFSEYVTAQPSFISETGIQSMPDLRTALTIGDEEDRHMQSFVFDTRNHFEHPAKNERLLKLASALFRLSEDFDRSVILSNLAQAEYLKFAAEHWRSLAYDCSGILIWQLNDCWPAISWSVIDFNLIPKAAYYYLRRVFGNDLVGFIQNASIDYDAEVDGCGQLFVATEREDVRKGSMQARIVDFMGEELDRLEFHVIVEGPGAVSLGELVLPGYAERRFDCLLCLDLKWEDGTGARNLYTFSRPKHMRLEKPDIKVTQTGESEINIETDRFAKGVYLFHPDRRVVFDDNYFDLLPGDTKRVMASQPFDVGDVKVYVYHH